jgi:23S rRNA-/tRNA-specific pseudouridylate synthase
MALHAYAVSFLHPWNGRKINLKITAPPFFSHLVGDFTL